ncbi:MAG: rhomboid family intramembrane serine protease [Ignavibacteriales bacterium]|nr:rhomboid family intramembrane serine protease [Ignavibacteriales bacterium]
MGLDSRDYYRPSGFGGFSFFPPVIKNLLLINIGVFIVQLIFDNLMFGGLPGGYILNRYFALNPITGFDAAGIPFNFQIWQIITYQFMHGSFTHILFNMFMLWMFGMEIENIMGSRRFLAFYLASGIGAGLVQLLVSPLLSDSLGWTIGASGAVFGVMIAFAMFFPDRYVFIYFLIPVKAKYLIAILVIFEFMSVSEPSVVAHLAHIGGAVSGFLFLILDKKNHFGFRTLMNNFKKPKGFGSTYNFRRPAARQKNDIEDAEFYDVTNKTENEDEVAQEEIDKILDKISQSGYKNLSNREKKILFEASKRK